jgi:hypothetical protein
LIKFTKNRFLPPLCPFVLQNVWLCSVPSSVEEKVDVLAWMWVELAIDETVDVVVCMMYNPGEFYCHILKEDGKLVIFIYFFLQICRHVLKMFINNLRCIYYWVIKAFFKKGQVFIFPRKIWLYWVSFYSALCHYFYI